jgi:DNA-binding LytR/AlgR family response regulator
MTRALIAEDEPLLRKRLITLLGAYWAELQIVAEACDGEEALIAFQEWQPDIVFLDIDMPKLSGIEVAHAIRGRASIVFLTAHADFAVDAFAVGAVDYLLKPLQPGRLLETIERLKLRVTSSIQPTSRLAPPVPKPAYLTWIQASIGNSIHFVTVSEVLFFKSDTRYTRVVTNSGEYLVRKTIKELTDELPPLDFVQISRGAVVNLKQVESVTRTDGQMVVRLKSGDEQLNVSPGYQSAFRQM